MPLGPGPEPAGPVKAASAPTPVPSRRAFRAPLALTLGLALLSLVPRIHDNPLLSRSFWGATLALLLWQAALFVRVKRAGTGRSFEVDLLERDGGAVPGLDSGGRERRTESADQGEPENA